MSWTFLTNHAQVLLAVAAEPQSSARAIAFKVGITERAVQRIIDDLEEASYLSHTREWRVNVYQVDYERPMLDPVGALLRLIERPGETEQAE